VNQTHFLKDDHLPDCASWDNQVKKGDHVECGNNSNLQICVNPSISHSLATMYDQQPMLNNTDHLECVNRNAVSFKTEGMV
jgi:hypothetical protein